MMTRIPLSLIKPNVSSGEVVAQGQSLAVEQRDADINEFNGVYDNVSGVLTLNIPGYGKINISGFPTRFSVGTGMRGEPGREGSPGINGVLGGEGLQGPRGCRGPQGPQGKPGVRGPRGVVGPPGPRGATGPQGIRGQDGRVQIFIQSEDPGPVGAGSLWIRP